MSIQHIRERINLKIYSSKTLALNISRMMIVFASIVALGTLIYYHGFPQSEETSTITDPYRRGKFCHLHISLSASDLLLI